jgi:hypothetical protein
MRITREPSCKDTNSREVAKKELPGIYHAKPPGQATQQGESLMILKNRGSAASFIGLKSSFLPRNYLWLLEKVSDRIANYYGRNYFHLVILYPHIRIQLGISLLRDTPRRETSLMMWRCGIRETELRSSLVEMKRKHDLTA